MTEKPQNENQIAEILKSVRKIDKKLNPPIYKKIAKISGLFLLWIMITLGSASFAVNFLGVKKENFMKCSEKANNQLQKRIDDAVNAAYSIEKCTDMKSLIKFSEKFDTAMHDISRMNKQQGECILKMFPSSVKDLKKDVINTLERMF